MENIKSKQLKSIERWIKNQPAKFPQYFAITNSYQENEHGLVQFNRALDRKYDDARYLENWERAIAYDLLSELFQQAVNAKEEAQLGHSEHLRYQASSLDIKTREAINKALIQQGLPAQY